MSINLSIYGRQSSWEKSLVAAPEAARLSGGAVLVLIFCLMHATCMGAIVDPVSNVM